MWQSWWNRNRDPHEPSRNPRRAHRPRLQGGGMISYPRKVLREHCAFALFPPDLTPVLASSRVSEMLDVWPPRGIRGSPLSSGARTMDEGFRSHALAISRLPVPLNAACTLACMEITASCPLLFTGIKNSHHGPPLLPPPQPSPASQGRVRDARSVYRFGGMTIARSVVWFVLRVYINTAADYPENGPCCCGRRRRRGRCHTCSERHHDRGRGNHSHRDCRLDRQALPCIRT